MRSLLVVLFLITQIVLVPAHAREVAGVNVPEQVTIANGTSPLQLNGAGVREKFFIDIYVGGLYLPKKTGNVSQIIDMPGAKRVVMHFLYKEVKKTKLTDGWTDGFRNNHTKAQFKVLKSRLDQFNALFHTIKRGEFICLDYIPAKGTQVWINETLAGTVPGQDFYQALLKVWLGDKPADSKLKAAMLGQ